jgi:hypothetical protein
MRTRKKYFAVEFVTDIEFMDVEFEVFCAESAEAVEEELKRLLGKHLIAVNVRKAHWYERRYAKKYPFAVTTL